MSDEKKLYEVIHPISFMGTKLVEGEQVEMTVVEAENIGSDFVKLVDEESEGTPAEEAPAEVPAEEATADTTETAPEGESSNEDKPAEGTPAEEDEAGEVVE